MRTFPFFLILATTLFPFYCNSQPVVGGIDFISSLAAKHREEISKAIPKGSVAIIFSQRFSSHGENHEKQGSFEADPAFFFLTGIDLYNSALVIFPEEKTLFGKKNKYFVFHPAARDISAMYITAESMKRLQKESASPTGFSDFTDINQWKTFCHDTVGSNNVEKIYTTSFVKGTEEIRIPQNNEQSLYASFFANTKPGFPLNPVSIGYYDKIRNSENRNYVKVSREILGLLSYYPMLVNDPILRQAAGAEDSLQWMNVKKKVEEIKTDVEFLENELRRNSEVKSESEWNYIRSMSQKLSEGIKEGLRVVSPGLNEGSVLLVSEFNAMRMGLNLSGSRIASGNETSDYHTLNFDRTIGENDLIVLDLISKYEGMNARVTRTFPSSGTFKPEDKKIYDLMVKAHKQLLATCIKGSGFNSIAMKAQTSLMQQLKENGLVKNLVETQNVFVNCRATCVGMEMEQVRVNPSLTVGNVVMVETTVKFRSTNGEDGKGFEIRDMVLITETGNETLSQSAPLTTEDIAKAVGESSVFESLVK